MPTWIVLLRGINVGGHGVLPMKRLVELMEKAGCTDVRTYIQSGNVACKSKVATASTLAQKIGKAILAGQGFEPKVMVLSREELEAVIAGNPYPVDNHKALHVWFLGENPTPENIARLEPLKHATEQYTFANNACYFYAPVAFGTSKIAATFEKVVKVAATARNWRTVMALQELATSVSAPASDNATSKKPTRRSAAARR
jgi:uncharacterized protein (DUF1697 family)